MINIFVCIPLVNDGGGNSDEDGLKGAFIWVLLGTIKKKLYPSGQKMEYTSGLG